MRASTNVLKQRVSANRLYTDLFLLSEHEFELDCVLEHVSKYERAHALVQ